MMGVVYHGSYLPWLEVARTDLFRAQGLSYRELEAAGFRLPVLSVSLKYHRPAVYDDEVTIQVQMSTEPRLRIHLDYEIRRDRELLVTAATEHAFIDREGRPTRPPPGFAQLVAAHFSSSRDAASSA